MVTVYRVIKVIGMLKIIDVQTSVINVGYHHRALRWEILKSATYAIGHFSVKIVLKII